MLLTRRARDGKRWWRRDASESEHTFAQVSMRSKLKIIELVLFKTVTFTSKDMLSPRILSRLCRLDRFDTLQDLKI